MIDMQTAVWNGEEVYARITEAKHNVLSNDGFRM